MSLNWREIDLILEELSLNDTFIQNIIQPDFQSLVLDIYRPGQKENHRYNRFPLLVSFYPGSTRLHALGHKPPRKIKLQRFPQLLRSRIKGCRILNVFQIPGQRIIGMQLNQGGSTGDSSILWLRLWGNAANAILCDADSGTIIDAFYRRPGKGEITGEYFDPRNEIYPEPDSRFQPHSVESGQDMNSTIEKLYADKEYAEIFKKRKNELLKTWKRYLTSQETILRRLLDVREKDDRSSNFKHIGDLLLANSHILTERSSWAEVEDYETGETLRIQIDPLLSINENAQEYYRKNKKELRRREHAQEELSVQKASVNKFRTIVRRLEDALTLEDLEVIPSVPADRAGSEGSDAGPNIRKHKGLFLLSGQWQIVVGRNSTESDVLLRSWARGNDYWIHTRDYPGGHIFLRGPKGKTPSLDLLLDAGNLAVYYSKARKNGKADCYYTRVKYLRRPREGKTGTVLPTQERNLDIRLDSNRISRVLDGDISDD